MLRQEMSERSQFARLAEAIVPCCTIMLVHSFYDKRSWIDGRLSCSELNERDLLTSRSNAGLPAGQRAGERLPTGQADEWIDG